MVTETDVQERIDRATAEAIEFTVASTDPLVLMAENADGTGESNTPYTVVPEALHCGCPDDTYRGPVCKHLIALMMENDWRGQTMRDTVENHYQTISQDLETMQSEMEALEERETALSVLRRELGGDERPQDEVDQEAAKVVEELKEVAEEAGDESTANDFRKMVEDLR